MSTHNTKKAILTTADILSGFETYGDDFMVIDIDTLRATTYAQYGNVYVKNGNGDLIQPRFWKLSGQGIYTCSSIAEPSKRSYASVRLGLSQINEQEDEIDNMKAMRILCEVFERKMEQFKEDKTITENKKLSKKQEDGTMRPVFLMSTKIETPMLTEKENKETGEYEEREHPVYYISIPKKRFYNAGETKKESVHFNNEYYLDADKNSPGETPIMSFEYQPTFYNIEDFYHHPRTGKKIYKKLGDVDEETGETVFDNTNIQKYLTRGSALVGGLKFELVVVGRYAKLDISLCGMMHVRMGQLTQNEGVDDECLDEFAELYSKVAISKPSNDFDEPEEPDF